MEYNKDSNILVSINAKTGKHSDGLNTVLESVGPCWAVNRELC